MTYLTFIFVPMHAEKQDNTHADHLADTAVVKEGQPMKSAHISNVLREAGCIDDF
uniref:RNase H type-1 domain-containing protein n=1 Tax=Arion vulgaris TaxID=1028688 RepID=A0A0B7A514_9EUPU